jgi:hypothetical protein
MSEYIIDKILDKGAIYLYDAYIGTKLKPYSVKYEL